MHFGKLNLRKNKRIAFDTETTGTNPWGDFKRWGYYPARPFAYSFCDMEGNTHFIRWQVDPYTREVKIKKSDLPFIQDILEDDRIEKIGQNIGFDIRMSQMIGIQTKGKIHDTLIMMHLITGGGERVYGLKEISKKFLDFSDADEEALEESVKKNRNQSRKLSYCLARKETHGQSFIKADYWLADQDKLQDYAVKDSERAALLFQMAKPEIEEDEGLFNTYTMEMELYKYTKRMEDRGVRIFPEEVDKLEKFYQEYMTKMKAVADTCGGLGLNYNSPKQMIVKFFKERKYEALKHSEKTGEPSADGDFLYSICKKDKLAKAILEYKAADQAVKSFLKPYRRYMVEEGGIWVLHPGYRQIGPGTGRMACSEPNLMNVGSETSAKKKADIDLLPRRCFGPRPGYIWYAPDYSQEEVWLCIFHADDKTGKVYLLSGKSFHGELNRDIWKNEKDFEQNKDSYRKRTKIIVFTKFYGGGPAKIAWELDCTEQEAKDFISKFNDQLPGIERFMREKTSEAKANGFIRTSFGRKIAVDYDLAYKAMNADIQGTAADIIKRSQIRLGKLFRKTWKGVDTLLNLHDELIIEVPLRLHSKKLMREVIVAMQADSKKAGIPVPLPVSMKIIKTNWSKEIKLCDKHLDINCKHETCKG